MTISPSQAPSVWLYDTTLRDGAQTNGISLSVADKITIAKHLDQLGIPFIEGGWPGANPKDSEFFDLVTAIAPIPGPNYSLLRHPTIRSLLIAVEQVFAPILASSNPMGHAVREVLGSSSHRCSTNQPE